MKNEVQVIEGIECYEENGVAYLNLEAVARGLGFTREKNGVEYVMWDRVKRYLDEIGFPHKCGTGFSQEVAKDDFIPENVFYRLAMKAKNAVAEAFQAKVADEIIPAIRKYGGYLTEQTVDEILDDPDTIIRLATRLKEARAREKELEQENATQKMLLAEASPKASYYDVVLQTPDLISISKIAKDYGKSPQWLNQYLYEHGVQYKQGGIWLLYQKYAEQGYTKSKTHVTVGSDGMPHSHVSTYWNQKGRLFIYDLLKQNGILPVIERTAA